MYILIVSRGYPSEKYKMNGIFEFDQAKALVQAGHKVIYAGIDVRSFRRKRKWGFESFSKEGVQVEAINFPGGRIPNNILDKIRIVALKKLFKIIEEKYGEPDIIHSHFLNSGYITTQLLQKRDTLLVLTEHLSAMNQKVLDPYLIKLGNSTYSSMDKVITVSTSLSNSLLEKFQIKATVIPNIVDTQSFFYKPKELRNDNFTFVSTGSLIDRKGMDLLIEAFNICFRGNKNVYLYIFGEGPERSKLEKLIGEAELKEQVFLMGLVDRKEIARKMSESNCFVLPSRLETFGVAYIEAMAMGLPVIATECEGPEDFVTKENGLLIPVNDLDSLVKSMKEMYESSNNYDMQRISSKTKEIFAPSSIARKLEMVYEDVLQSKKSVER